MHAAFIAHDLNVPEIVVPTGAGVASAVGLLVADVEFHLNQTDVVPLEAESLDHIDGIYRELEAEGRSLVDRAHEDGSTDVVVERAADMKYEGQAHELTVHLPKGPYEPADLETIRERFHETYSRTYGYSSEGDPIEGVTWKLVVRSPTEETPLHTAGHTVEPGDPYRGTREAYFERSGGFTECDIYDRRRLAPDDALDGPAIVEAPNSTTVIPPGDHATVDEYGNLIIDIEPTTGGGQ
jgi:N-methylhydantoinase A/oxoprolinase/acetone carboxylase beta subunit